MTGKRLHFKFEFVGGVFLCPDMGANEGETTFTDEWRYASLSTFGAVEQGNRSYGKRTY